MNDQGFLNNFSARLAGPISASDKSFDLSADSSDNERIWGAIESVRNCTLTLADSDRVHFEIVQIRDADRRNIFRGAEGTEARNWGSGTEVYMSITAETAKKWSTKSEIIDGAKDIGGGVIGSRIASTGDYVLIYPGAGIQREPTVSFSSDGGMSWLTVKATNVFKDYRVWFGGIDGLEVDFDSVYLSSNFRAYAMGVGNNPDTNEEYCILSMTDYNLSDLDSWKETSIKITPDKGNFYFGEFSGDHAVIAFEKGILHSTDSAETLKWIANDDIESELGALVDLYNNYIAHVSDGLAVSIVGGELFTGSINSGLSKAPVSLTDMREAWRSYSWVFAHDGYKVYTINTSSWTVNELYEPDAGDSIVSVSFDGYNIYITTEKLFVTAYSGGVSSAVDRFDLSLLDSWWASNSYVVTSYATIYANAGETKIVKVGGFEVDGYFSGENMRKFKELLGVVDNLQQRIEALEGQ